MTGFYANTALGRVAAESTYTFQNGFTQETDLQVFTSSYTLVAFETAALLGFGVFLHARGRKARGFPFITLGFVSASSAFYSWIGTGWEVNHLPDLSLYRNLLTSPVLHASFQHITGNLPYFVIVSSVLEYWISKENGRRRYLWYLLPLVGTYLWAAPGMITGEYSFGLSILIELLAFAIWTYAIEKRNRLLNRKRDVSLVLLAGLSMAVWYGWVINLFQVPFNPYTSAFDLSEAQAHVVIGGLGLAASLIYLCRKSIDRYTYSVIRRFKTARQS
jgi:membrane associated rhomboid family serine protease